jgi:hypothetical protein
VLTVPGPGEFEEVADEVGDPLDFLINDFQGVPQAGKPLHIKPLVTDVTGPK